MTKIRVFIFLLTLIVVGIVGTLVTYYARGYRFDIDKLRFIPNGILVLKSDPDGASVYIDGELKTATNATISLLPTTYDVSIRKEGYFSWNKRLEIQKEVVTEASASLFKSVPSLSPVTFSGAINPQTSHDMTRIAYSVLPQRGQLDEKSGLWVIEILNLPLGFPRDPKRVTDGDLTGATYKFSPDGREILLTIGPSNFLLDSGTFTPQAKRVNIGLRADTILKTWEKESSLKLKADINRLPPDLVDILTNKTQKIVFSPDKQKILYTASGDASIKDNLIPPLPGASTQNQERHIKRGNTYIYDIKEDRNFLTTDREVNINSQPLASNAEDKTPSVSWFPTSRHVIFAEENKVTIMDYDSTNKQTVYSGSYVFPSAFPYLDTNKLLILTNLGGDSNTPNLYSLTLK